VQRRKVALIGTSSGWMVIPVRRLAPAVARLRDDRAPKEFELARLTNTNLGIEAGKPESDVWKTVDELM
jgi:hypothetical protein